VDERGNMIFGFLSLVVRHGFSPNDPLRFWIIAKSRASFTSNVSIPPQVSEYWSSIYDLERT
jgi:hypothetical protein